MLPSRPPVPPFHSHSLILRDSPPNSPRPTRVPEYNDTLSAMYGLGEPLNSLVLELERAKKHTLELEAEYTSYRKDRRYRIDFKTDPVTRSSIY
jgi:hypothetical protein